MRLSIIIPTLNEQGYLSKLLSEIKRQNFNDLEIIVADAASNDETIKIAYEFGCKVVAGGSPAKGRNEGAKAAKSELLLFMDADTLFLPENFFEKAISDLEKRKLGIAAFPIFVAGNKVDKMIYKLYNLWVFLVQKFLPYASNAILVKKSVHETILGFDEQIKIAEDHDYARRASRVSKFGLIKTKPILTSARRFEAEGRLRTYFKYFLVGFFMLFGPIKLNIVKYRFDYPKNQKI